MASYTVKSGDTLSEIAERHGTTWEELWNHPENADFRASHPDGPDSIHPGDVLWVPDGEASAAAHLPGIQGEAPAGGGGAKAELYDLFWAYPLPRGERSLPVELTSKNPIDRREAGIPAAILFPALLTPDVMVADAKVELLILTTGELYPEDVNRHLKVSRGLDARKEYLVEPLFASEVQRCIEVESAGDLGTDKLETASRFAGMADARAVKLYKDKGFTKVFRVVVDGGMLEAATRSGERQPLNDAEDGSVMPPERDDNQDHLVRAAVETGDIEKDGKYGFKVASDDVRVGVLDPENPVQSHHPVFHYDCLDHAGVGHMSDIHASSRQQMLAKSGAKVIEAPEIKSVGDMINICSRDAHHLLQHFGGDGDVDVVFIGGDLVDYIKNICDEDFAAERSSKEVWDVVDMESLSSYKDNVDFLSIYSLIVAFYRGAGAKPIYAVTGNHDCYYQPYGISPRVLGLKRANEGIPADHNLTMYEAILSFGRSYGKLVQMSSSFDASKLDWFYTVYTPFTDFSLQLPNQYLVGLGWGNDEKMISLSRSGGHGMGHLPRANECVSDRQLAFLESTAVDKDDGRKVILTTHFTFASYNEAITNEMAADDTWGKKSDQGDIYYTGAWYSTKEFSKADMGTFELNREPLYAKIIGKDRKIQLILTGHSHRRGFYTVRKVDTSGNNSIKTGFHDFPKFRDGVPDLPKAEDRKEPWIILSDSGGSIPRMNVRGEFKGWGSDSPGGTVVAIDDGGKVTAVRPVRTPVKPRFVVALDYLDIMESPVFEGFESNRFKTGDDRKSGFEYTFNLKLADELVSTAGKKKYGIDIREIVLYHVARPGERWTKIPLIKDGADAMKWKLPKSRNILFRLAISRNKTRGVFLSIRFGRPGLAHLSRYDFSTPWTFEVKIDSDSWYESGKYYNLERDSDWREIPDFDRREQFPEFQ